MVETIQGTFLLYFFNNILYVYNLLKCCPEQFIQLTNIEDLSDNKMWIVLYEGLKLFQYENQLHFFRLMFSVHFLDWLKLDNKHPFCPRN